VSHRSLRSTLVPFGSGLAAVIAVFGVLGTTTASGAAAGAVAGTAVRTQEWWLAGLHVTQAWQTTEGAGVTVAVLGTGVAASHPDLTGDVTTGPDYSDSGRQPGRSFWGIDGTAVASVIAGHGHGTGGESGLIGVAPAAKILSIRVSLEFNDPLNADRAVTQRLRDAIADGIIYAVDHGARVIDLPLDPATAGLTGHGDPAVAGGSPAEQAAVTYALGRSVVLVAPAGDDGQGPGIVNYPAAYTGVIAVGAISRNGRLAPFSSRHSYVSLTAPGADLLAATPPDSYAPISSTSTASGIVAGVAALILSRFPHLTVAQVAQALTGSTAVTARATTAAVGGAAGAGTGAGTGDGTVDAARAVELAADITSAGQARAAATPALKPGKATRPPNTAARRSNASALAGSLVRDVVVGLGVLILLLIAGLAIMSSRRRRAVRPAEPGRARTQGMHEHRRADRDPRPDSDAAGLRAAAPLGRPKLAQPGAPAAGGWPAPGGWQGSSAGEIAHSSNPPFRPAMTPVPKIPATPRSGRSAGSPGASASPAGPPWAPAPAPAPERTIDPRPVASPSSFSPRTGRGIRVPGDMTALPATTADPAPSAFDFPPTTPGLARPATIPAFEAAASPAFEAPATSPAFEAPATSPDLAEPTAAPDLPTRRSLDFAAAPVATEYPAPTVPTDFATPAPVADAAIPAPVADAAVPAPVARPAIPAPPAGPAAPVAPAASNPPTAPNSSMPFTPAAPFTPPDGSGPAAKQAPGGHSAADSSYLWDLAATDVFPVARPETPDATNDDAPGASGS
jgi:serine protease